MTKRIAILAALVAVAVTLAGCGFKHPVQWIEAEEKDRIEEALERWVDGIEDYDVDAMAGSGILAAGFRLVIKEGQKGEPYEKNAAKLMEELLGDRNNQLTFRKVPDEGGAGYQLEFDVDWVITKINKSSATVNGEFGVWETIDGGLGSYVDKHIDEHGWWNSDNGLITIELVRTPNAWKMISMTIVFNPTAGAGSVAQQDLTGLGIGKLPSMLGW
jgi:predicted small lipoprotein YifL